MGELKITPPPEGGVSLISEQGESARHHILNAERFIHSEGEIVRYCHDWEQWLIWDGMRWKPDAGEKIVQRCGTMMKTVYFDQGSASMAAIHGTLKYARSDSRISIESDALDAAPLMLNVPNGLLALKSGSMFKHQKDSYQTKLCPTEYDPDAECPQWLEFLNTIMLGNENLTAYLQRVVGYALTGLVQEEVLFFLYGLGENGKKTFLMTLTEVLGHDYCHTAAPDLLGKKPPGSAPFDIANLRGKRFVVAREMSEGQPFAEATFKRLVSRDRISARHPFGKFFEFPPTHHIFLTANSKPVIRSMDHGTWRRVRLIPFKHRFDSNSRERAPELRLAKEAPGILAWAVQGAIKYLKNGLEDPPEVCEAVEEYKDESDPLNSFLDDCCTIHESLAEEISTIYSEYTRWAETNSMKPLSKNAVGRILTSKGFTRSRKSKKRLYAGLALKGSSLPFTSQTPPSEEPKDDDIPF